MMHDYFGGHMGGYFFPGFGIFLQLILFIVFLGIIYWVINSSKTTNDTAENILDKRLAKGEISKKEYLEIKKELNKK